MARVPHYRSKEGTRQLYAESDTESDRWVSILNGSLCYGNLQCRLSCSAVSIGPSPISVNVSQARALDRANLVQFELDSRDHIPTCARPEQFQDLPIIAFPRLSFDRRIVYAQTQVCVHRQHRSNSRRVSKTTHGPRRGLSRLASRDRPLAESVRALVLYAPLIARCLHDART